MLNKQSADLRYVGVDNPPTQEAQQRMPTFIVIGACRCGTTTLHYALGTHPQICMSTKKETNFFMYYGNDEPPTSVNIESRARIYRLGTRTLDEYLSCFRGAKQHIAVGETSPFYMATPEVPERIKTLLPNVKLLAILRQPAERAYSGWRANPRQLREKNGFTDFSENLEIDDRKVREAGVGTSYIAQSRYGEQLKRFFDVFDRDQIMVCLYEDMQAPRFFDPIFNFLGVDRAHRPDLTVQYNQSEQLNDERVRRLKQGSRPLKKFARKYLPYRVLMPVTRGYHTMLSKNIAAPEGLPREQRIELTRRYFAEDISKLEELLNRDLSLWLR